MKLSEQDAKLFFDLMWALQNFVNQKLKILSDVKSLDDYAACSTEGKIEVRKALYADTKLIDSYVQKNPQNFSDKKLSIVSNWKNYIRWSFSSIQILFWCWNKTRIKRILYESKTK